MSATQRRAQAPQAQATNANAASTEPSHLERELAFYASYHSNPVNKLIHFICIPQILWSSLILLGHLRLPGFTFVDVYPGLTFAPSAAMFLIFAFQFYYITLDDLVGGTYMPVSALMYLTATYLVEHVPAWLPLATKFTDTPSALPFGLAVFLNGWAWQFFGHFKFEGRAPALTENLTQALVTAPFFVHIEMLFGLFNWNPTLHKRIVNAAGKRIVEMNRAAREKAKKAE